MTKTIMTSKELDDLITADEAAAVIHEGEEDTRETAFDAVEQAKLDADPGYIKEIYDRVPYPYQTFSITKSQRMLIGQNDGLRYYLLDMTHAGTPQILIDAAPAMRTGVSPVPQENDDNTKGYFKATKANRAFRDLNSWADTVGGPILDIYSTEDYHRLLGEIAGSDWDLSLRPPEV